MTPNTLIDVVCSHEQAPELRRRFRTNLFTGELEEVYDNPVESFKEINEKMQEKVAHVPRGRNPNPWNKGKDHVCRPLSLKPEDATPERIEKENAAAKKHGTGAYYTPDGECVISTRAVRAREMRRRQFQDNDAGYGDHAGR